MLFQGLLERGRMNYTKYYYTNSMMCHKSLVYYVQW